MPLRGKVTTGDGILKELYEVSARYQARGRPDRAEIPAGHAHDSGALWVWLETVYAHIANMDIDGMCTPEQMRYALLDIATGAVAWAREIREDSL